MITSRPIICLIVATALVGCVVQIPSFASGGMEAIRLHAQLPSIEDSEVPGLNEQVRDALQLELGAKMNVDPPYQWVVEEDGSIRVATAATNGANARRAVLTVWDWHNRPVEQRAYDVPMRTSICLKVAGRGTWLLTLDVFSAERCLGRLVRSFSACPSNDHHRGAWRDGDFWVGICGFPGRQHWRFGKWRVAPPGLSQQQSCEREAELMARLGMTVYRPDTPVTMNSPDQPLDFSLMDESLQPFIARGFELNIQPNAPGEAVVLAKYRDREGAAWRYPVIERAWRRYVRATAQRYARHAKMIQIWNEPDNEDFWRGTPEEFCEMYRWALEEIRPLQLSVPVAYGGLTQLQPDLTRHYLQQFKGSADLIAYHSHGDLKRLVRDCSQLENRLRKAGCRGVRLVNTETGVGAWRLDYERQMAITLPQKLLYCWAHGHEGVLLYASRMCLGPRRNGDDSWGIVDYFFCPRFAYGALSATIDVLAGCRFERIIEEKDGLFAYEFKAPRDTRVVAVFKTSPDRKTIRLSNEDGDAKLIDIMGNIGQSLADPSAEVLEIEADYYPVFVSMVESEER